MKNLINEAKKQGLKVYQVKKFESWVLISDGVRVVYAQKNIYGLGYDFSAKCSPKARNLYTGSGYQLESEFVNIKKLDFWSLLDRAQRPANFYDDQAKKTYKPATLEEIKKDAQKFNWTDEEI